MTFLTALFSALPQILRLITLITSMVRDYEQRGIGRAEAVKEALEQAHRDIAAADAAASEARASHTANPDSDDGFDLEFRRRDP